VEYSSGSARTKNPEWSRLEWSMQLALGLERTNLSETLRWGGGGDRGKVSEGLKKINKSGP